MSLLMALGLHALHFVWHIILALLIVRFGKHGVDCVRRGHE